VEIMTVALYLAAACFVYGWMLFRVSEH